MNKPAISVFLPTYARYQEGYLPRAVDSLLAQTSRDFELIVIDDGSIDGTADYLARLARSDARVRHIRLERNTGLPAFLLADGYKHAQGNYFAWLFDDCELMQGHLETLAQALDRDQELGMVYALAEMRLSDKSTFEIGKPFDQVELESGNNFIPNVCVMIRRSTIEVVGLYDPHVVLKRMCDWDLWRRVARKFRVGFVDQVLATEHGGGLVSSLGWANEREHELVMKYAASERNDRLAPAGLTRSDCFRRDIEESLTCSEKVSFEFTIFEHALQTMDETLVAETITRLDALGAYDALRARYSVQQQVAPAPQAMTMLASLAYVQRRSVRTAQAMIDAESNLRATLAVAEQRLKHIYALEQEVAAVRTIQSLHTEEARAAVAALSVAREEHCASQEILQNYRNVADQRLALLGEASQSLGFWRELADERLRIIEGGNVPTTNATSSAIQDNSPDEG